MTEENNRYEIEGEFEYENSGNGYFFQWYKINGTPIGEWIEAWGLPWKFKGKLILIVKEDEQ